MYLHFWRKTFLTGKLGCCHSPHLRNQTRGVECIWERWPAVSHPCSCQGAVHFPAHHGLVLILPLSPLLLLHLQRLCHRESEAPGGSDTGSVCRPVRLGDIACVLGSGPRVSRSHTKRQSCERPRQTPTGSQLPVCQPDSPASSGRRQACRRRGKRGPSPDTRSVALLSSVAISQLRQRKGKGLIQSCERKPKEKKCHRSFPPARRGAAQKKKKWRIYINSRT